MSFFQFVGFMLLSWVIVGFVGYLFLRLVVEPLDSGGFEKRKLSVACEEIFWCVLGGWFTLIFGVLWLGGPHVADFVCWCKKLKDKETWL